MYPALAVHSAVASRIPDVDTLWVGGEVGMEEALVKRQSIAFQSIPAAGMHCKNHAPPGRQRTCN